MPDNPLKPNNSVPSTQHPADEPSSDPSAFSRTEYSPSTPGNRENRTASFGTAPLPPSPPPADGRTFGDYELLEEIARGGMGVVYKARQISLGRVVALKMILSGPYASGEAVERFRSEARAAALLDHPGIVPIYEIGEHDGRHFFSMALVEGGSLQKLLANGPLLPRDAARLVRQVADAVQYAHDQGIVHRDLKPANVLLDCRLAIDDFRSNQTPAPAPGTGTRAGPIDNRQSSIGNPKVTDFGLAKTLGESGRTASGEVMGTPSFMPPEQAAGRIHEIGPRSDVYSLGAVLYATLTGRPPFQAATVVETLRQVCDREPVPPRQLNAGVPRDLETICLKCLQKSTGRRYSTARELVEELDRFLAGQPVKARPVGTLGRGWRWCRRNPAVAGLLAAVVLLLVAGAGVSTYFAFAAADEAREAGKARKDAEAALAFADEQSRLALQSLNTLVVEVQDQLRDTPATAKLKRRLLETALDGLTRLSESADRAGDAGLSLVEGRNRLGELFLQLADRPSARREFEAAVKTGTALVHGRQPAPAARVALATSLAKLAAVDLADGNGDAALKNAKAAEELCDQVDRDAVADDVVRRAGRRALAETLAVQGRISQNSGDLKSAENIYTRMITVTERLAFSEKENVPAQVGLAHALVSLGTVKLNTGDSAAASDHFRTAIEVCRKVVKQEPNSTRSRLALAVALEAGGEACTRAEQLERAESDLREALTLARNLLTDDPENLPFRLTVIRLHNRLAVVSLRRGDRGRAREYCLNALPLAQAAVTAAPNRETRQSLLKLHDQLGGISLLWGGLPGARGHFRDAVLVAEQQLDDVKDATARRDLIALCNKVGDASARLGDLTSAREEYQKAAGIARAPEANREEFALDVAASLRRLGEVELRLGDSGKARDWFVQAAEALNSVKGTSAVLRERYTCFRGSAQASQRLGEAEKAAAAHRQQLAAADQLARDEPRDQAAQLATLRSAGELAEALQTALDFESARGEYTSALTRIDGLVRGGFLDQTQASAIRKLFEERVYFCQVAPKVIENLSAVEADTGGVSRALLVARYRALARNDNHSGASQTAERLLRLSSKDPGYLFDAACGYALALKAVGGNGDEAMNYRKRCLSLLGEALDAGYRELNEFRRAADLAAVRGDPSFKELEARLAREVQDPDRRVTSNSVGMLLVHIPRGKFQRGSTESPEAVVEAFNKTLKSEKSVTFQPEHPRHEVEITKPFSIGMTEVSVAQFRTFVEATKYKTEAEKEGSGGIGFGLQVAQTKDTGAGLSWSNPGSAAITDHHPVVQITWNDAQAYCKWLSEKEGVKYRLPTEAEWEYACRAGKEGRWFFGDDSTGLLGVANVPDQAFREAFERLNNSLRYSTLDGRDGYGGLAPVGEYGPNPWGLYDVHGNVWELCQDFFDAKSYEQKVAQDPRGPADGQEVVARGGSFGARLALQRAAARNPVSRDYRNIDMGFRVVREE